MSFLITHKAQVDDFSVRHVSKARMQGLSIEVDSRFRGNDGPPRGVCLGFRRPEIASWISCVIIRILPPSAAPILPDIGSDRIKEPAPVLFLIQFRMIHHDVKKQWHETAQNPSTIFDLTPIERSVFG